MIAFLKDFLTRFSSRRRKLMLIAGDENVLHLVKMYLQPLGRDWLVARSAGEAHEILNHCGDTPALLVIDQVLPGAANGVELLHAIRSRRDTFRTPALLLHNGLGESEESTLFQKFPRLHLAAKPLEAASLMKSVQQGLRHGDRYRAARSSLAVEVPRPARGRSRHN